jgi:hypothetical protein
VLPVLITHPVASIKTNFEQTAAVSKPLGERSTAPSRCNKAESKLTRGHFIGFKVFVEAGSTPSERHEVL